MRAGTSLVVWALTLVGLLAIASPVAVVLVAGGMAIFCIRAGNRLLPAVGCVSGAVLCVLSPIIASFGTHVVADIGPISITQEELATSVALGMRLAAVVMAGALMTIIPPHDLLLALARRSQRTALLAALVARFGPVSVEDARRARDELRSAGVRMSGAPLETRIASRVLHASAVVASVVERAFATAAAIESRAFGARRPIADPLPARHVQYRSGGIACVAAGSWAVLSVSTAVSGGSLMDGWHASPLGLVAGFAGLLVGMLTPLGPRHRHAMLRPNTEPVPIVRRSWGVDVDLHGIDAVHSEATRSSLTIPELHLESGAFILVTGASGSGKSTLLDVIAGRMPHLSGGRLGGVVRIDGRDVTALRSADRAAMVGTVFQDPEAQSIAGLVVEEVAFGPRSTCATIEEVEQRTIDALTTVGCLHLADRDVGTLSGGELQRVMLAAALALEPRVLLLDEPTSQLDALGAEAFWSATDRLRVQTGVTVVVAEHRIEEALKYADRVISLEDGVIVGDRPASEVVPSRLAMPRPWPFGHQRLIVSGLQVRLPGNGRWLVHHLDAVLPAGSVVAVLGPNGSGKSTLLRAVRGLHERGGTIHVDGVPVGRVEDSVAQFAYASQHAGCFLPYESAAASVGAIGDRLGIPGAVAVRALEHAGLDDLSQRHPADMSVGQRQRLAIVAATAHQPPVWVLDEPTRGMDGVARSWLIAHVAAHARRGGVVLMATHDAEIAELLATHSWTIGDQGLVQREHRHGHGAIRAVEVGE